MKKISILIPTYNEVENVELLTTKLIDIFTTSLNDYDYEIVYTDNHSEDGTQAKLEQICKNNEKVKAIFNVKNFRGASGMNGLKNTSGDCTIQMAADFQDPPELIIDFVKEWEKGYKIVVATKKESKENLIMKHIRNLFYRIMQNISEVEQIPYFSGFALYDDSFMDVIRNLKDSVPYLRGVVGELGFSIKTIEYVRPKRYGGKSKSNFMWLYDQAMKGITSYSKVPMRICTLLGIVGVCICFLFGLFRIIRLSLSGDFFLSNDIMLSIILFFIFFLFVFVGILSEYIMSLNKRSLARPLVIEEKRLNFDDKKN